MTVTVNGQNIYTSDEELIVSESVDIYECEFEFDSTWDGWDKTAKFEGSGVTKEMILIDDKTSIPNEVIKEDGWMRVGVYGTRNAQVMPTIWGTDIYVHHGTEPESTEITPTPSIYAQILALVNSANDTVEAVQDAWEAVTASASTLPVGSSATVSFSDNNFAFGLPTGATGATGATGNGIQSIAKTGTSGLVDTYTITFTNGSTTTFAVTNGEKGDTGNTGAKGNGISSITKTGTSGLVDTYTIAFTDGTSTTFTVTNGEDVNTADLAPAYSSSNTYAVGDYCIYSSQLYRCTTAITTAEAWTAAHWTAVTMGEDVSDLRSAFDSQPCNLMASNTLKAYIVETKARCFWAFQNIPTAFQTPANFVDEVGAGNPFYKITGNEGDDFVTVVSGGNATTSDISGYSDKWAAVISYDGGVTFETCIAWYVDADKIGVYPPLKANISSGELGSQWHDSMHLTRRGYIGFAQAIFNAVPKYCEKKSYIAKWVAGETNPFTEFGGTMYSDTSSSFNYGTGGFLNANQFVQYMKRNTGNSETTGNRGIRWEVQADNKTGYAEIMIGGISKTTQDIPDGYEIYIDLYEDNILKRQYIKRTNIFECIYLDFANATNVKIEIYLKKQVAAGLNGSGFRLSSIYFWENQRDNKNSLFPRGAVVGQMFDSWGEYHDGATAKELSRLINAKTGVTVPYTNHSLGGQTSAWGKAWFYENVQKYNPSISIVDFGINDANSQKTTGFPPTVSGPDGTTYDNIISTAEYTENMQTIADEAKSNGIQIIMTGEPRPAAGVWYYALVEVG